MKHLKILFTTIALLLSYVSANAEIVKIGELWYDIDKVNNTAEVIQKQDPVWDDIKGMYLYYDGNIIIPDSIEYDGKFMKVTSIGSAAFSECSDLYTVVVPKSVKRIGDCAFMQIDYPDMFGYGCGPSQIILNEGLENIGENAFECCEGLTNLVIPSTVKSIGDYAFFNCINLYSISISDGVVSVGENSFYGCTNLKSENDVQYVGKWAVGVTNKTLSKYILRNDTKGLLRTFENCTNLSSISIPTSVSNIGNYTFYGCSNLSSITIPENVVNIGSHAFADCFNLASLTISGNVNSIGSAAFSGCGKLTSVVIPNSIKNINEYTFSNCSNLISINIPQSVTSIGTHAFRGCSKISSVIIPQSMTTIDSNAFLGCTGLVSVTINSDSILAKNFDFANSIKDVFGNQVKEYTIGGNVKRIGNHAFSGCINLEIVNITVDIESIGDYAFHTCEALSSITIPEGIKRIGTCVFFDCFSLLSIQIPESVTIIDNSAFNGCFNLSSILIPQNVTSIGYSAFYGCTSLSSIVIPENLTSIGGGAFEGCSNLVSVTINSDSVLSKDFSQDGFAMHGLENDFGSQVKKYTIGGNVKKIGSYAFNGCDSLKTVNIIANSVTSIGNGAFLGCANLSQINIPDSVRYIGHSVFSGCTSLPVESGVRYADKWAVGVVDKSLPRYTLRSDTRGLTETFSECVNILRITLPDSIIVIGESTFKGCQNLKAITLPKKLSLIGNSAFSGCSALTSLSIPVNVTEIGSSAFSGCTAIKNLTLPNNVSIIGCNAFKNCTGLTSMIIPDNVKTLGTYLFYGCNNLSSVTLPTDLTKIPDGTFGNCNLSSYEISENVDSIGADAFYGNPLKEIVIPSSVTEIGNGAFAGCYNLISVDINSTNIINQGQYINVFGEQVLEYKLGGSITDLQDYAFFNCQQLKNVTLPDSLVTIGESAFERCVCLDSIYIPKTVTNIGDYAFYDCANLTSVKVGWESDIPTISSEIFTNRANAILYVPSATKKLYEDAAYWNEFKKIVEYLPDSIIVGDVNNDGMVVVDDIVNTINYLLGEISNDFIFAAADMNADGQVFIDDVELVINAALGFEQSKKFVARYSSEFETLKVTTNSNNFALGLSNAPEYTAMLIDMNVPSGMSISEINVGSSSNHNVAYSEVCEGLYRIVLTSLSNDSFAAGNQLTISINGKSVDGISINNAFAATSKGKLVKIADVVVFGDATGIQSIGNADGIFDIYDIYGRLVKKDATSVKGLNKGVYMINGKKQIVK